MILPMILGGQPVKFDADRLYFEWQQRCADVDQACILTKTRDSPLYEGSGSLYDEESTTKNRTAEYVVLNKVFENTYTAEVIEKMREYALQPIGRVRFLDLKPKTCYSYHRDPEEFRYHIPILTNRSSFFIINGKCFSMPEAGRVYLLRTREYHTALNADKENSRLHMVFDTHNV